jgi:hypothetical protein
MHFGPRKYFKYMIHSIKFSNFNKIIFFFFHLFTLNSYYKKREEKLDSILDQMRESSSEKDLKRLMGNVNLQLEAIKRGYVTFKDSQCELVKQYPSMVRDELRKYEDTLYKFFSILKTSKMLTQEQQQLIETSAASSSSSINVLNNNTTNTNVVTLDDETNSTLPLDSFRHILKEILSTEKGTKFYVTMRSVPLPEQQQQQVDLNNTTTTNTTTTATVTATANAIASTLNEDYVNDLLAFDELIPHTRPELVANIESKPHLRHAFIPIESLKEIRSV